jgi:hypothetical protein
MERYSLKSLIGNPAEKIPLGSLGVDGRIILNKTDSMKGGKSVKLT